MTSAALAPILSAEDGAGWIFNIIFLALIIGGALVETLRRNRGASEAPRPGAEPQDEPTPARRRGSEGGAAPREAPEAGRYVRRLRRPAPPPAEPAIPLSAAVPAGAGRTRPIQVPPDRELGSADATEWSGANLEERIRASGVPLSPDQKALLLHEVFGPPRILRFRRRGISHRF